MKTSRLAHRANSSGASYTRAKNPGSRPGKCSLFPICAPIRVLLILVLLSCGILDLRGSAVRVAWSPVTGIEVDSYRLSYGTSPGVHSIHVDAGSGTGTTLKDLAAGTRYSCVVRAIRVGGEEGPASGETS